MQENRAKETNMDEVQKSKREYKKIPVGGEIFRTYPDLPWGPHSLFHGGKATGAWR